MEWILIIHLLSPGGDFMGKFIIELPNKKICETVLKSTKKAQQLDWGGMPMKIKGDICVTRGHWEGWAPMKNVPYD